MTKRILTEGMMRQLVKMPPERLAAFIAKLPVAEVLRFDAWFEAWADRKQLPPSGEGWRNWLLMAGRGFGKTRAGAEWIHQLAMPRKSIRIALVRATLAEARSVMVEGRSGLIAIAAVHGVRLNYEPGVGRLRWPGGSEAQIFSGDSPEQLRGPEHHYAWCDELAKWRGAEAAWDNLQMGLRAGARPRALVTTTPRAVGLLKRIMEDERTVTTHGRSVDNISLPKSFLAAMEASYGNSALARQELEGELIGEPEGSLFPRALIERARTELPEEFDRIVVAVDPPASSGEGADECGIVVAGKSGERIYVLADCSVKGERPEGWARCVANAAEVWKADRVVAEANQGGEMVESVLRAADAMLPVTKVFASRGKVARAEPIAVRFEAGRAFLAGHFPALEGQMNGLMVGGEYRGPGKSPTTIALFDLPDFGAGPRSEMFLAAASASAGWRAVPVEVEIAGQLRSQSTAGRESVLGFAETALPAASFHLPDLQSEVVIQLVDKDHWLEPLDDNGLFAGANLAVLGDEIIQFGVVTPMGEGRFRLSRLLRGLRGSDWAMASHGSGDAFALLDANRMAPVILGREQAGGTVSATPHGLADDESFSVAKSYQGEALRPPSPTNLTAKVKVDGSLVVSWTPRSRLAWGWIDGVDPGFGESSLKFRVTLSAGSTVSEFEVAENGLTVTSGDLQEFAGQTVTVTIEAQGDHSASHPRSISLNL